MNEQALRHFIVFAAVGNLLDEHGFTASKLGFTDEEMERVITVAEKLAPGDKLPPEYFTEAKRLFRESLDALLQEVTDHRVN